MNPDYSDEEWQARHDAIISPEESRELAMLNSVYKGNPGVGGISDRHEWLLTLHTFAYAAWKAGVDPRECRDMPYLLDRILTAARIKPIDPLSYQICWNAAKALKEVEAKETAAAIIGVGEDPSPLATAGIEA